ncbi:MAG: hypothetical protein AAF846_30100 [Chloroflexota bacterium]
MKIQGYDVGTKVQWTDSSTGGFRTGIVRARYYDPDITEIDGETIEINVVGSSPTYKVEDTRHDEVLVIDHTKVTTRYSNTKS